MKLAAEASAAAERAAAKAKVEAEIAATAAAADAVAKYRADTIADAEKQAQQGLAELELRLKHEQQKAKQELELEQKRFDDERIKLNDIVTSLRNERDELASKLTTCSASAVNSAKERHGAEAAAAAARAEAARNSAAREAALRSEAYRAGEAEARAERALAAAQKAAQEAEARAAAAEAAAKNAELDKAKAKEFADAAEARAVVAERKQEEQLLHLQHQGVCNTAGNTIARVGNASQGGWEWMWPYQQRGFSAQHQFPSLLRRILAKFGFYPQQIIGTDGTNTITGTPPRSLPYAILATATVLVLTAIWALSMWTLQDTDRAAALLLSGIAERAVKDASLTIAMTKAERESESDWAAARADAAAAAAAEAARAAVPVGSPPSAIAPGSPMPRPAVVPVVPVTELRVEKK